MNFRDIQTVAMENGVQRAVNNLSYDDLKQWLQQINNKSEVRKLELLGCSMAHGKLIGAIFNGFHHLIDLNLNNCAIETLQSNVFDNLVNLKSISLSNNALRAIESEVFKNNGQLQVVILNSNLLKTIAITIENLEILDLSYNMIAELENVFLSGASLKRLYLNDNRISEIHENAFYGLPSLTCLILSSNKIQSLHRDVFINLVYLRYLNLDDNLIRAVGNGCFRNLISLNTFCLGNDYAITRDVFRNCENLVFLKLTISNSCYIGTIANLKSLTHLDLVFNEYAFLWSRRFRRTIFCLKSLQILKLVFKTINEIHLCNFSIFTSLVHLHIECMEPSHYVHQFEMFKMFPNSSNLEYLALVMLNNFTIENVCHPLMRLKYLNLSGLKNVIFPDIFSDCVLLEYLDLSFSEITAISKHVLRNFVNLKVLRLQHSKLELLEPKVFQNNRQLQYLNCSHCCIRWIGISVFSNLDHLVEVNLSNNPVPIYPHRSVYGLNETCRFIFDS